MTEITPALLTVKEAAAYLAVSVATVRRWVQGAGLPEVQVGGVVRYSRVGLDAWVAGRERVTPPAELPAPVTVSHRRRSSERSDVELLPVRGR